MCRAPNTCRPRCVLDGMRSFAPSLSRVRVSSLGPVFDSIGPSTTARGAKLVVGRCVLAARPLDDTPQPLGARRAGVVRISLRWSAPSARRNLFLRAEALLRMMAQRAGVAGEVTRKAAVGFPQTTSVAVDV